MIRSDGPGPDGQVEGVEQERGDNDILISLAHGKKKMLELVLRDITTRLLSYDALKDRMYDMQKQGLVKVTEDESGTAFKGYIQITDKGKKVIDAFMAKAGVKAEGVIQEMWENMVELLILEVLAEWGEEDIGKVCKTVAEWAGKTESEVRGELDRLAKAKLVTLTPESNKTAAITREGRSKYDSYQRYISKMTG
jgi:DNA-binding PadR family transcriptional regulator